MLSKVKSFGLSGLEGFMVTVEVDVSASLPGLRDSGTAGRCRARIQGAGALRHKKQRL